MANGRGHGFAALNGDGSSRSMPVPRPTGLVVAIAALAFALACGRSLPMGPKPASSPIETRGSPEWSATNAPFVSEYLTTLSNEVVGESVDGITLSDGRRWFEGYVYLGPLTGLPPETNGRLFRVDDEERAYLWLEEGAEALALEPCGEADEGIRARRWSGEVLPWKALRAEHGVVYTACPREAWSD